MLAHAIESGLIDEAIVRHEADDAVAPTEAVRRPPKELHVGIVELVLLLAFESLAYVSRTRSSTTLCGRFLLLSFSFFCPTLYGGFPMITVTAACFSRSTRSVLAA